MVRTEMADVLAEMTGQVDGPDVDLALRMAPELTALVPVPGGGSTATRWQFLAGVACRDLTVARVLEAHLDAVAILAEARAEGWAPSVEESGAVWGVYAAEAPGAQLRATPHRGGRWLLEGTKPWCSLAARVSAALVTATTEQGRGLFAVDTSEEGFAVRDEPWAARGLVDVPSGPVHFTAVPAVPVGPVGWYLDRPGFSYGGMGVAACWYGGARGVAGAAADHARRRTPDQLAAWHLGALDCDLYACDVVLDDAAAAVDSGAATGEAGRRLALRVRSVVASAAERVVTRVGHATGPAPLVQDPAHARRVADLMVYLRQHHAERDDAALGSLPLVSPPW